MDHHETGHVSDFHWAIPRISQQEKHFLAQILTSLSKDVSNNMTIIYRLQIYYSLSAPRHFSLIIRVLGICGVFIEPNETPNDKSRSHLNRAHFDHENESKFKSQDPPLLYLLSVSLDI